MSEWQRSTLGALTVNHDSLRRPVKLGDRTRGPYPYYGASGVIDYVDGYTHDGCFLLVSEDGENLRSRSAPIAFMVGGRIWVNNHAHVLTANGSADIRFLHYLLAVTDITAYLTGSAQPKLSKSALESVVVLIPDLREQRKVSEVLAALDEKIAADAALVARAETLAVALVEGCERSVSLSEIVIHHKRMVLPEAIADERVEHHSLPAFDSAHAPGVVAPGMIKSGKFEVAGPSVLVSKLNPRFPRIWDLPGVRPMRALASTEFLVLESRYSSSTVLWAVLSQPAFSASLESQVAGTSGSHQRVRPADLLATMVTDPRALSDRVTDVITALGQSIASYRAESLKLAELRDVLLPELMSGRLRVKDAEKVVEEVV